MKKIILDEDLKYIDRKGNLLRSKTELSLSRLLSFLEKDYEYDFRIKLINGKEVLVDFKVDDKYIEILDSEEDLDKFNETDLKPFIEAFRENDRAYDDGPIEREIRRRKDTEE